MSRHLESDVIRRRCNYCGERAVQSWGRNGNTYTCIRCTIRVLMELEVNSGDHIAAKAAAFSEGLRE